MPYNKLPLGKSCNFIWIERGESRLTSQHRGVNPPDVSWALGEGWQRLSCQCAVIYGNTGTSQYNCESCGYQYRVVTPDTVQQESYTEYSSFLLNTSSLYTLVESLLSVAIILGFKTEHQLSSLSTPTRKLQWGKNIRNCMQSDVHNKRKSTV